MAVIIYRCVRVNKDFVIIYYRVGVKDFAIIYYYVRAEDFAII